MMPFLRTKFISLHSALCLAALLSSAVGTAAPADPDFFENRVRPILVNSCFACHTNSQLGGLRVDSRESLLKGGPSGPAIVPGDPDKSILIQAIRQMGELKMPKGGTLKKQEIQDLTEWVRAGAVWPKSAVAVAPAPKGDGYVITSQQRAFWSFQPLKSPPVPSPKNAKWARSDIDRFILARLEKEGITPVKQADKITLIRRATLDITGLLPTPEEIDGFVKDTSPDAFAKVVDRLLESPQYGVRWGRLWLDVARYGEDDYRSLAPMGRGYMPYPNAYVYRDWAIKAMNKDIPYDLFVKAQLAGDQLDEKLHAKVLPALGFLGQGLWLYDNGAPEITRADERHDRVDVVTRGFLGLTVACARCHDHKYDPIPTADYYSLSGVFANSPYHEYPLVPQSVVDEYKKQEKKIKDKEKLLAEFQSTESLQLGETLALQTSKYMQAAWKVTGEPKEQMAKVVDEGKLDYELLERFIKFLAKPPKFYPYLTAWQAMIQKGGTAAQAKKIADEFQVLLLEVMFEKREMKEENEIIVAKSLLTNKKKERASKPNDFVTHDDFCPGCGLELKTMAVDRMNLWTDVFQRDLDGGDMMQSYEKMKPGLLVFRGWGLERQLSAERRTYLEALRTDAEALRKALPPEYPYVHGVMEAEKPINLQISRRGNPYNLGDEAPRRFLQVLSTDPIPFKKGSGRLELAEEIVKQPLAMRVIVNRIWKWHFGSGIVDTPSNFGAAGERPTNPELLEYLSKSFVDNGMSMKKLHRQIMLSSVYQLSNDFSKPDFDKDSGNRLYWRANRHRMDAEQIRDTLLQVSGAIEPKLDGPSEDLKPQYNRRTAYGKVSRYKLDEYLQLFDFPSPNITAEQRFSTNVPLQRLFFMNSDFVQQQAELLARRVADEKDKNARIEKMYRILFGRSATPAEIQMGIDYLKTEPMREYEEKKAAKEKAKNDKKTEPMMAGGKSPAALKGEMAAEEPAQAEAEKPETDDVKPKPDKPEMAPAGMFAGMGGKGAKEEPKKPLLPVTIWGRYAKVLLSSTEFTFVK